MRWFSSSAFRFEVFLAKYNIIWQEHDIQNGMELIQVTANCQAQNQQGVPSPNKDLPKAIKCVFSRCLLGAQEGHLRVIKVEYNQPPLLCWTLNQLRTRLNRAYVFFRIFKTYLLYCMYVPLAGMFVVLCLTVSVQQINASIYPSTVQPG